MKAIDRAYEALANILNENGLELTDGISGKQIKGAKYVGYQVWDRHDSYENTDDFEAFRAHGHIEVTAAISRMGGEMSAEDFTEAAAEMAAAATVLAEITGADLSYVARINGEEV